MINLSHTRSAWLPLFLAGSLLLSSLGCNGLGKAWAGVEKPVKIGTYKHWTAYSFKENGHKVCYMMSSPIKQEYPKTRNGRSVRRDPPYIMVTHRPGHNTRDTVSIVAGYLYEDKADVDVKIKNEHFGLVGFKDTAWCPSNQLDKHLTTSLLKGDTLVVKAKSKKGTQTTDTYSLSGSMAAYKAICEACRLKPLL